MKRGDIPKTSPVASGGGVPAWLTKALPTLIQMLSNAIEGEAAYPRRPDLRKRFNGIEDAARLLMKELKKHQIRDLLIDGDIQTENEYEMLHGLRDIADRAAKVRARNPRRPGRNRLYPKALTWPTPMELCALMVAIACHQVRGRWPGKNDAEVHKACEELWKAAGGSPRRGQGEPREPPAPKQGRNSKAEINWGRSGSATVVVWRNHLKAARNYRPPHQAGTQVLRILVPDIRRKSARGTGELGKVLYVHSISHTKQRVGIKTK